MKLHIALIIPALMALAGLRLHAQTLNWGNEVWSSLADSKGDTLDNAFVFELGSFASGFTPDATNVDLWAENWHVFDQADYNGYDGPLDDVWGYFTSTVQISGDPLHPEGDPLHTETVTSSYPGSLGFNFSGLEAYIWVRNSDDPVEGTEWLLVRADTWTFPVDGGECCDVTLIEWSISDLDDTTVPVWGRQSGLDGGGQPYTSTGSGSFTADHPYDLQTFTFVPEPSTAILSFIGGLGMVLRRRRHTD